MQESPIQNLVSSALAAVGIDLYDLSLQRSSKHDRLVVYIDKPGGVNIADCTAASKQIQMCLATDDAYSNYAIEVSSPGVNRALTKIEHYSKAIGKNIKIKYKGEDCNVVAIATIESVDGDTITMKNKDLGGFSLNLSNILKAKLFEEK